MNLEKYISIDMFDGAKYDKDISAKDVNLSNYDKVLKQLEKDFNGTISRAYTIGYMDDKKLSVNSLSKTGGSWCSIFKDAMPYRDVTAYDDVIVIQAKVNLRDVDWLNTMALRMIDVRGDFEGEIRVKRGKRVQVFKAFEQTTKDKYIEIEMKPHAVLID